MPTTFTVDGGSTCHVRMATAEDAPAVHRLVCELEQQTFDYDTFRERFISQLENPAMHCFILELDGTSAGYLNMRIDRHLHHACPTAEIIEFIVDDTTRGKGIGAKMFACARNLAVEQGCELIELASKLTRVDAHRFYERQGMTKTHAHLTMPLP